MILRLIYKDACMLAQKIYRAFFQDASSSEGTHIANSPNIVRFILAKNTVMAVSSDVAKRSQLHKKKL